MVNHQKQTLTITEELITDNNGQCNIKVLSEKYQAYPEAYIEIEYYYDDAILSIHYSRLETDEELQTRISAEKLQEEKKRKVESKKDKKDYALFLKLKEKFPNE